MTRVHLTMTRVQRRYLAFFSGVIGVLLILFVVVSTSSYSLPSSVIEHEDAKVDGGTARYRLKLLGVTNSIALFDISSDIEHIAKHEVKNNNNEGTILFTIVGDGQDIYGNSSQVYAFDLQYTMDDLKKINWDNIDCMQLLNLGIIVNKSPAGTKLISDYCEENRVSSEVFCAEGS